mgnify:CR=1 FL=1
MQTDIFVGYGFGKKYVGCCENGIIFLGRGWNRTAIGSYERDGSIYAGQGWNRTYLGKAEAGDVFSGYGFNRSYIGSVTDGNVFLGYGWNKTFLGSVVGLEQSVAAAALLLFNQFK